MDQQVYNVTNFVILPYEQRFGGDGMYNEKNEMEKVNFGDLPVDWEDDVEFAEEQFEDEASTSRQKNKNKSYSSSKIKNQFE